MRQVSGADAILTGNEHFAHLGRQFFRTERFLDERCSGKKHVKIHDRILGVGRHVQDLDAGTQGCQAHAQFASLHSRHEHIGQHEVDGLLVTPQEFNRFHSASRFFYGIALDQEEFARHAAHGVIILDDKNCFLTMAVGNHRPFLRRFYRLNGLFDTWQKNLYRRSLAWLARNRDAAAALVNDSIHGGKAQPGPLVPVLGREKGIEHARLGISVHSNSGIADGQAYIGAG